METALKLLAEIQMIIAEHAAGTLDDHECVERIKEVLDRPGAIAVSLDIASDSGEND